MSLKKKLYPCLLHPFNNFKYQNFRIYYDEAFSATWLRVVSNLKTNITCVQSKNKYKIYNNENN